MPDSTLTCYKTLFATHENIVEFGKGFHNGFRDEMANAPFSDLSGATFPYAIGYSVGYAASDPQDNRRWTRGFVQGMAVGKADSNRHVEPAIFRKDDQFSKGMGWGIHYQRSLEARQGSAS